MEYSQPTKLYKWSTINKLILCVCFSVQLAQSHCYFCGFNKVLLILLNIIYFHHLLIFMSLERITLLFLMYVGRFKQGIMVCASLQMYFACSKNSIDVCYNVYQKNPEKELKAIMPRR